MRIPRKGEYLKVGKTPVKQKAPGSSESGAFVGTYLVPSPVSPFSSRWFSCSPPPWASRWSSRPWPPWSSSQSLLVAYLDLSAGLSRVNVSGVYHPSPEFARAAIGRQCVGV
jgi:hypothetical protein